MINRSGDDTDICFLDVKWLDLSDTFITVSAPASRAPRHSPRVAVITLVAYHDVHSRILTLLS